ncbi:hypothetical protein DOY81_014795 [Sarcophaga bullata]|nr:hypothetical protein DOY81_014795 [Sarcophaga bullata]
MYAKENSVTIRSIQVIACQCHIFCNSVADRNCAHNPSNLLVCPIYDKQDSCVTALDDDGFLRRGCSSQIRCSNTDNNYCNVCNTNGCNTVELKGSASVATNSLILTLLLAFVSVLALKI